MQTQKRIVPFALKGADGEGTFEGHAAVFGVIDEQNEIVRAGAFARSLAARGERGVKLLWQHAPEAPIGVIAALREDARGLYVKGRLLLELEKAREAHVLLKSGAVDGLSIGFITRKSERDPASGARALIEIDLWEVSLVTFPANPLARVAAAKAQGGGSPAAHPAEAIATERQFERFLREAGFSRARARAIAGRGFKSVVEPRDAAPALEPLRASLVRACDTLNLLTRRTTR